MGYIEVARLCSSWPGTRSEIKWRDVRVFSVAGKMFCLHREPLAPSFALSLKVAPERFLELTDQPGIAPAPYLARHGWIQLSQADALPDLLFSELLYQSYCLVRAKLPKKQRAALNA